MKSRLLLFVSFLSTSLALTACGGFGEGEESGGGNSITLPNTAQEAANMFYQLATSTGVEITYRAYDDESNEPETNTIGFKNDVFWVKENVAYKKADTTLEMYEYDATKQSYEYQVSVTESEQTSLDLILKNFSSVFYAGYEYASTQGMGSFTSKKDVTFLTRPATEYTLAYSDGVNQASLNIIFDNATGITLKIYAAASSSSDGSSAEYEVTSFAIGNAVIVPTLNKSSGQGGEGQGGEGQGGQTDVDYFNNKLLMYTSHENAPDYVNSQLGLFADGKFELKSFQNGYQIVFFGKYVVAASKTSATLVTERVYKDQVKETSSITQTWTLDYSDGAYTLAVSSRSKAYYNASGAAPTHYVIPGQGGGESDVENFVNHFFTFVSQQNAQNFVNSTIALFDDGTFEVVTTQNGNLLVYLGTYTVNANDTAATLSVTKYYSAASGAYTHQAVGNWLFTLQQNGYALAMAGGPTVIYALSNSAPTHANIPADEGQGQTGDDAKYKVNEAIWNEMIVNRGIISLASNFTMITNNADGQTKYEFDSGKVHYTFASSSFTTEMFYEFTSLTSGTFYYKNNGQWASQVAPADMHLTFDDYIGVLPVPYSKVSFNSTSYYYGCNEWKDEQQDAYQNPRFFFEEGNLIKTTYKHWDVEYLYTFNEYGTTSVTLPEVSGGQSDEDAKYKITSSTWEDMIVDAGLVSLESNFTAMVRSSDLSGVNKYEFDEGLVHKLYNDGYEEYIEFLTETSGNRYLKNESGAWASREFGFSDNLSISGYTGTLFPLFNDISNISFSQLTFNKQTKGYELSSWSYNGGSTFTSIYFSFVDSKLMKVSYTLDGINHETEFNKHGTTSVTLPEIGSGGEGGQTTSKWPAADIAAKLAELELNVTVPAPKEEYIESVTDEFTEDYNGLFISVTAADANYSSVIFSSFVSGFQGFVLDATASNIDDGIYVLFNETRDIKITMTYSRGNPTVTVLIEWYEAELENTYPVDSIAAFFKQYELTTALPSLEMEGVAYHYGQSEYAAMAYLTMAPSEGNTLEAIVASAESALTTAGFKIVYVPSMDGQGGLSAMYIDPALQYYVFFSIDASTNEATAIIAVDSEGEMAAAVSLDYPQDIVESFIPEYTTDTLPSLAIDGAAYMIGEDGDGFQLQINLQPGMEAANILRDLTTRIGRAGYIFNEEDEGYHSANNQIVIYISNIDNKLLEIQVRFIEEEEPPVEEFEDVTYTFICDDEWDIFEYEPEFYVYVWNEKGETGWIELSLVEGKTFTAEISTKWTHCTVVRLNPNVEEGQEWEPNWDAKWNQSKDLDLSGEEETFNFNF